jgi:glycerophosphoryl diester phosphodiesterase
VIPYLSPAGLKIFAHRGSTEGGDVENTLEAFRFAIDAGVTYLESDVQATSDGVAVLFHDSSLQRVAGLKGKVCDYTFAELSRITLGERSRIPSLKEALERFPNVKWNLDLKTSDAIGPAVKVIEEVSASARVLVSSFSRGRRTKALRQLANVATSADAKTILLLLVSYKLGLKAIFRKLLSGLDALQIPTSFGPIHLDDPGFINEVTRGGVEVHYWTINTVEEATRLIGLGAKGIVTDKSKMMVERFGLSQSK